MKKLMLFCFAAFGLAFASRAENFVNLSTVSGDMVVTDGSRLHAVLNDNGKISIAPNATVTLWLAIIQDSATKQGEGAGITCLGDATIILEGENYVCGRSSGFPAIYVPEGSTLTIKGTGKLTAIGNGSAAGIGGGNGVNCGNIVIAGGIITAEGGSSDDRGSITYITDDMILAPDSDYRHNALIIRPPSNPGGGPGIGAGNNATCGKITFNRGNVTAWARGDSAHAYSAIGASAINSSCERVEFKKTIGKIKAVVGPVRPSDDKIVNASEVSYGVNSHGVEEGYPGEGNGTIDSNQYRTLSVASKLGSLTQNKTFKTSNDMLEGELSGDYKISLAKDAMVTLENVTIGPSLKTHMPGITCNGNASINLIGTNYIQGCGAGFPGISVPENCTLQIFGKGVLIAVGGGDDAPGIGSCYQKRGGTVIIEDGYVNAFGGKNATAIGCVFKDGNDDVQTYGGVVRLKGGEIRTKAGIALTSQPSILMLDAGMEAGTPDGDFDEFFRWNGDWTSPAASCQVDLTAYDKTTLAGEASGSVRDVYIAPGARITLRNAEAQHMTLWCKGDAEVTLEGYNNVIRGGGGFPAIYCPKGHTVTFKGDGLLSAYGGGNSPAIGGADMEGRRNCGNIVFDGGVIVAQGGFAQGTAAGDDNGVVIGAGPGGYCGKLTFNRGYVRTLVKSNKGQTFIHVGMNPYLPSAIELGDGIVKQSWEWDEHLGVNAYGYDEYITYYYTEICWDCDLGKFGGPSAQLMSASPKLLGATLLGNSVQLNHTDSEAIAGNDSIITGTLSGRHKIAIAHDATVTLKDAKIPGTPDASSPYAGLTCLGNATIILEGTNEVSSFHEYFPAISVPSNCTLVITGTGSLVAGKSNVSAAGAGIGGGYYTDCGNIIISNGTVTAYGGSGCAGIGSGSGNAFDTISIVGGTVTASGRDGAAGIGTGYGGRGSRIIIGSGVARVIATAGGSSAEPIGKGQGGTLSTGIPEVSYGLSGTTSGNTRTLQWDGNLGRRLEGDLTAYDGTTIYGVLGDGCKTRVLIAPGAHVTLKGAKINASEALSGDTPWAGITCLGDATITIKNDTLVTENTVNTFNGDYPAIFVPGGSTLTLEGDGTLDARNTSGAGGAGIGGGSTEDTRWCGNIVVNGGDVTAYGGTLASGIGGGDGGWCDGVVIGAGITHVKAVCGSAGNAHALCHGNNGDSNELPHIANGIQEIASGTYFREFRPNPDTDLSTVTADTEIATGAIVTGTLSGDHKISLAAGAEVTLNNVTIRGNSDSSCPWAGINCLGNATIWLEGVNIVKGSYRYPGIHVPSGCTLTIKSKNGDGVLNAYAFDYAAGIGGGWTNSCGNIYIEGGIIYAEGGTQCAGIGGGTGGTGSGSGDVTCGNIRIDGGTVTAKGGIGGCGIGAGAGSSCGNILISSDITYVEAIRGSAAAAPIGKATQYSECGTITIASNLADNPSGDGSSRVLFPNVDLTSVTSGNDAVIARNGATISGRLGVNRKITIVAGATVTISNATINGVNNSSCNWAGLTCEGDATIILAGTNTVKGFYIDYPGIYVPKNRTLTIKGSGSLDVRSSGTVEGDGGAAGIGGGWNIPCGNIVIEGGTIAATGTATAAAIGGGGHDNGASSDCGDITISGGIVNATGGRHASGIGAGYNASCGRITINGNVKYVVAVGGPNAPPNYPYGEGSPIGLSASGGSCAGITVGGSLVDVLDGQTRTIMNKNMDLAWLTSDFTLQDGMTVTGTLGGNYKVSIAAGASITLNNATIQGENYGDYPWAGLTCLGDATITLNGTSNIKGFLDEYPGIYVPTNCTLTIDGTGSLVAQSNNGSAAGIGAGYAYGTSCGNIVINGGTITAYGGSGSAGIGGGDENACGDITINGGTVTAYGGKGAAGIGGGFEAPCGIITIGPDISLAGVTATRGDAINGYVGEPIGRGSNRYGGASCAGVAVDPGLIDETNDAGTTRTIVRQQEVDLSTLAGNIVNAPVRTILTGTLANRYSITVKKDNAVITLRDVTINLAADESFKYPGIICNTNVTIVLEGENYIKGHYRCPAIYIKEGCTLTIKGSGSLTAVGGSYCAGIGAGVTSPYRAAGNIVIESGSIKAEGGTSAPGIGSSTAYATNTGTVNGARCGTITITGGTVEAIANGSSNLSPAAIGCGTATCGNITIGPDVTKVVATWNSTNLAEPIGSAYGGGTCGTVNIALTDVEDEAVSSSTTKRTYQQEWDGDLGTLNRAVKVRDGTIITGTQTEAWAVRIADGAAVLLHDATFMDGLTCLGDAEVILAGENKATIGIGAGNTLTISGNGTLIAEGGGDWIGTAGIGGGDALNPCGNIEILGGTIIASGGGTASGAAAIGSNPGASCGTITIGPGVKKVVATVSDTSGYDHANPIGAAFGGSSGKITVDSSLNDTTSDGGLTRTITRAPGADAIAAYEGWRGDQLTNGVAYINGAWNETDAKGVPNVMRYAFDKPADEDFNGSVVIDFETDGNGLVAIQTLPVVNGKGLFSFTIVASDNADGTGNVVEYPLSLESDGITYIEEEYNPSRFFRVRVDLGQ